MMLALTDTDCRLSHARGVLADLVGHPDAAILDACHVIQRHGDADEIKQANSLRTLIDGKSS